MSALTDRIDRAIADAPRRKPFIVFKDGHLTYGALHDGMLRYAGLFGGVPPHSRVIVATADETQATTALLALIRCGHAAIMVDPAMPSADILALARNAGAAGGVLDQPLLHGAPELGTTLATVVPVGGRNGAASSFVGRLASRLGLSNGRTAAPPGRFPDAVPDEATAYIMFTSGTTAAPKGVVISHRNFVTHLETLVRQFSYDRDLRLLLQLPLHFTDGLSQGIGVTLLAEGTLFRPGRFAVPQVPDLVDWVHKHRITHFYTVPTVLALLDSLQAAADAFRTPDFRYILSSAGHLEETLWRRFEERFGVRIVNVYGLTETVSGSLYSGPDDATRRVGTLGRPVDCDIRIVADSGDEADSDMPGELLLRGPHIFKGYFRDPDGTEAVVKDGWFHTGDIVARDADGFVRLVGRRKNMIKRGGISIYPERIVSVLKEHPAVVDAVAFGVDHPVWGETVTACVILGGGAATPADLMAWSRQRLPLELVPNEVRIVDSFPRGPAGKPIVARLKAELAGGAGGREPEDELALRVRRIAAARFGTDPERLDAGSSADSVPGWDSYAHMELMVEIEQAFDVKLTPKDIMAVRSLGRLEAIVRDKLSR